MKLGQQAPTDPLEAKAAALNRYFTPTAALIDAPTLLFVREETFRALAQAPAGRSVASNLEIDAVIDPADTRHWLLRGLEAARVVPVASASLAVDTW